MKLCLWMNLFDTNSTVHISRNIFHIQAFHRRVPFVFWIEDISRLCRKGLEFLRAFWTMANILVRFAEHHLGSLVMSFVLLEVTEKDRILSIHYRACQLIGLGG